jgi:methylglutaconyl-CoA hydratase
MSDPLVLRRDEGPVTVLTLNRPEKRNALSRVLIAALGDAFGQLKVEPSIRAVVLAGAGPSFCAGMDLSETAQLGGSPEAEKKAVDDAQAFADLIEQVHKFPRPTIATLNGEALAGGAGLALACDFVIATERARIGFPEVHRGLVAAIVMHDLIRQVGERRARQMLLGGGLLGANQAAQWGLFTQVVAGDRCDDEALRIARELSALPPIAVATTKRLIDEATGRPRDLRGAAAISASVRVGDEAIEGMRAFLEKRPPSWAAREETGDRRQETGGKTGAG